MRFRIPLPLAIVLACAFLVASAFLILSPRVAYTRQATSAYDAALGRWQATDRSSYAITVISNSLTQPTGGTNTIRVDAGRVTQAHNPNCPDCSIEAFAALTVEGLFQRIQTECLRDFPIQFCGVDYHPSLGFPVRIDTYPYNRHGQERPSISVEDVQFRDAQ